MHAVMATTTGPFLSTRAPDRAPAVAYVLACSVLLVAGSATAGRGGAVLRALVGIAAVVALLHRTRQTSRIGTNPWLCLAAGVALAVSAATVGSVARAAGATPPLWCAWPAFAGYVALGVGFLILARVTVETASRTAFLDGAVIGTATVMLLWVSLIAPMHTETMDAAHRITLAMWPVRDGVLVAILAWITLAPGRRTPALRLLALSVAILLLADLVGSTARNFDADVAAYVEVLRASAWSLLGLAALLSSRDLRIEPRPDTTPDHPARSVLIGVALLMGPVAAVVGDLSTTDGVIMIGVCSTVLALGVMARFVNLVHQNRRAHAATAISERRFRMLADSAPVGIFELARGMRVSYANAEGSRLLGPGVIGGSVDEMLANVDRSSQDSFRDALDAVARGEPAAAELRLAHADAERWVAWQGVPVLRPGTRLPMAFASTLDITDLKRAQAALARQATHDPLTGLPNRRLLIDALIEALADLGRGHRTGTVAVDVPGPRPLQARQRRARPRRRRCAPPHRGGPAAQRGPGPRHGGALRR